MDVQSAKQQVIRAGKELSETGLISRTWGNVSCLLDKDYFAISASGRNYMTLTEDEVIPVKLSDLSYAGSVVPSSEIKVHQAVYQMREGTGFVIHTHQDNASAVSAMNIDWVTFNKEWPGLGKRVFCAEYGLPGSKALAKYAEGIGSFQWKCDYSAKPRRCVLGAQLRRSLPGCV